MKKIVLRSMVAVIIGIRFSSCSKCQTCNQVSEPEIKVCEEDYASNTEYGSALDYYQGLGYDCN